MFIMFLRWYLCFVSLKKLDVFIGGRWGRDIVEVGLEAVESVVDMRMGRDRRCLKKNLNETDEENRGHLVV
jgi:hypothetical protein